VDRSRAASLSSPGLMCKREKGHCAAMRKYLRIVATALCLMACVQLVVLWARK
jgi:hypothetical protein